MALNPFLDVLDVPIGVFEVLIEVTLVAVKEANFGWLAGLDGHRPRSMLDAGCDVAWECVGLGGGEVHVFGAGFGVEVIEGVLG
jgi:hypothetical protein